MNEQYQKHIIYLKFQLLQILPVLDIKLLLGNCILYAVL